MGQDPLRHSSKAVSVYNEVTDMQDNSEENIRVTQAHLHIHHKICNKRLGRQIAAEYSSETGTSFLHVSSHFTTEWRPGKKSFNVKIITPNPSIARERIYLGLLMKPENHLATPVTSFPVTGALQSRAAGL